MKIALRSAALFAALSLSSAPAASAQDELPFIRVTPEQYEMLSSGAQRDGQIQTFETLVRRELLSEGNNLDKPIRIIEHNNRILAASMALGTLSIEIPIGVAGKAAAAAIRAEAESVLSAGGEAGGFVFAILAVLNAIVQPLLWASTEETAMILVGNDTDETLRWAQDVYHGTLTHHPATFENSKGITVHQIPPRNEDGIAVAVFVFEKDFGFHGAGGVLSFIRDSGFTTYVGAYAPYRDGILINHKNRLACGFHEDDDLRTQRSQHNRDVYTDALFLDLSVGQGFDTQSWLRGAPGPQRFENVSCNFSSVDAPATTMLVDISTSEFSNFKKLNSLETPDRCRLVPDEATPQKRPRIFRAVIDCSEISEFTPDLLIQESDRFWGITEDGVCPLTYVEPITLTPANGDPKARAVVFDCGSEPASLNVDMISTEAGFTANWNTQIDDQTCWMTMSDAIVDSDDLGLLGIVDFACDEDEGDRLAIGPTR